MCWGCEQTYKEVMQPHLRAEVHEYRHPNMPDMLTAPKMSGHIMDTVWRPRIPTLATKDTMP